MKFFIFVVALLFTSSAVAYEQGDTFLGAQFGLSTIDLDNTDDIEHRYGLLRLGVYTTPSLTLELRYGGSLKDDSVSGVDYRIDRIAGVYAAYHFEISSEVSLYGLLGYSEIDMKASRSNGTTDDEDETDPSFGVGLNISGFNLEYIQYIDRSDYKAQAISAVSALPTLFCPPVAMA